MKLIAEIESNQYSVEIKREGELVFAKIDERMYQLEAAEVEPNLWLLKYNNQIFQIYIAPSGVTNVGNSQFDIKVYDPRKLRPTSSGNSGSEGRVEIKTAMPGKIVRVLIEEKAEVQKGEGLIVVEAMKMQNEMKAPKDGTVKEIRFAEGTTVNAGDILIVIE